jgi:hypothetical protein
MSTAADKVIYKTVDHYTFEDCSAFSTRCVDYLSIEILQGWGRSFWVRLVCRLPHDRNQRILAERLVIFDSREEMLDAYESA